MKIKPWLLLVLGFLGGQLESNANPLVVARGLVEMDGKPYVVLSIDGPPRQDSPWLKKGERWNSYKVLGLTADSAGVLLVDDKNNPVTVAFIPGVIHPTEKDDSSGNAKLIPIELLDWNWIKSDANEMRDKIIDLPPDLAIAWRQLGPEEQLRLRNYYRIRGINLEVDFSNDSKLIHVTQERIRDPKQSPPDKNNLLPVNSVSSFSPKK